MVPFTLLGKRRGVKLVIGCAGILWGAAATCFAAVSNYNGAFACRFFVGLGGVYHCAFIEKQRVDIPEAGFVPLVPFYLARMYTKKDLGARVAFWLAMAPMGCVTPSPITGLLLIRSGFFNGIIAYGVSFIHSHLESWRVLFLIEGLMTILIASLALVILPENVERARWLTGPEKDYREFCADADNLSSHEQ